MQTSILNSADFADYLQTIHGDRQPSTLELENAYDTYCTLDRGFLILEGNKLSTIYKGEDTIEEAIAVVRRNVKPEYWHLYTVYCERYGYKVTFERCYGI